MSGLEVFLAGLAAAAVPATGLAAGAGVLALPATAAVVPALAPVISAGLIGAVPGSGVLAATAAAPGFASLLPSVAFGSVASSGIAGATGPASTLLADFGSLVKTGTSVSSGIMGLMQATQEPPSPPGVDPQDATAGARNQLARARSAEGLGTTRLAPNTRAQARLSRRTVLGVTVSG